MGIVAGIRARLLLLAAACTLPMFALVTYDAWRSSETQIETARDELRVRAQAEADELDRNIRSATLLLRSMALTPAIAQLDPKNCSEQLAVLAASHTQTGNAFGINLNGDIVCRATPNPARINVVNRDYFARAYAEKNVVIGQPVAARLSGNHIVPLAMAVRTPDGQPTAVLSVTINISQFARNNAAAWVEDGTAVTWWDNEARVTFRWPDPEGWTGRPFAGTPLGQAILGQSSGHLEAPGADGIDRIHGFASIGKTGMKLSFSIPRETLVAPYRTALKRNLLSLAVFTLTALVIAWVLGEILIRRPLFRLTQVAGRMEAGDLEARCEQPYPRDEIGALAQSFDNMAGVLAAKITALRDSEEQLRNNLQRTEQAEQRVRQQLEHMNLLDQITRSIGERLDLNSIFQVVVRTLEDSLPVDFCCVALHDAGTDTLRIERIGVKSAPLAQMLTLDEQTSVSIDNNGLSRCMRGDLVYEPDIATVRFPFPERLAGGGLRSLVLAPLRSESRVFGVLVAARREAQNFSSIECEFLRQLSEHIALGAGLAQLHGALQQAYDDLRQTQQVVMQEERLRALGQMASGIAHDINNALSPVSLYTESLLETEANLSPRARGYLETILRAVEDVAQTVARMREFYRKRESQLTLSPVDVNQLAQQVLDLTRARWSDMPLQKGHVINTKIELAPGLPSVMGVESEIREALTNLVFNAVDAMPEGGTLTLRTRLIDIGETKNGGVAIEIADDGAGMDEETRRRCMEPFFTTKGERGTGLGLAMVFGMVQRHSAELELDSAPGQGTTARLVFTLPATILTAAAAPATAAKPASRLHLLLVDDDPVLLKSLRDALETDGHSVTTATGGKEGIETFQASVGHAKPFAAVITDLGMPYVDGRKVAVAIKEASAETPVILLTGWGQRLIADNDIPSGVDRVLSKPPKLREVREALAALCRK
jgi:signal transduction histidine kinase/ActR/RegA family two-component response regulator/HAMP domain-containing protein